MAVRTLRVGLIGAGYMGKAFTLGYRAAAVLHGPSPVRAEVVALAASSLESARAGAAVLDIPRATGDWRELVEDPSIDIVANNTPNHLHHEINMAAIAAGKHVHSEKPLGRNPKESRAMMEAAEARGVRTIVGFNYRQNPAQALAREIVQGGEIGEVVSLRATHNEDYYADPDLPITWKCFRHLAGAGALADVGSHIVSIVHYLLGDIAEVAGQTATVVPTRPKVARSSERVAVETEDIGRFLCRFACGATGMIEASRVATGRKMLLGYEITGTRGSIAFNQERLSELQLYRSEGPPGRRGFTTLLLSADHPRYGAFGMGPGHGIGFNDQKILEAAELLQAIHENRRASPDFREAWKVDRVIAAVLASAEARGWARVEDFG
jgi:predicted dehydrogenase